MTLTSGKTVGQLAAEYPMAAAVFEKHQIDYCCGGNRPLGDVCREKGINIATLEAEVESARSQKTDRDWAAAPLAELASHIVSYHHAYLKTELPALEMRLAKVLQAHGPNHGESLQPLAQNFAALKSELTAHMMKEELILFPIIQQMEHAETSGRSFTPAHCGSVQNPIRVMEHEHDSAGRALAEMRRVTGSYQPPADACNTYRALLAGLEKLEADLHVHIHLENNILFPRAAELERRLANGKV